MIRTKPKRSAAIGALVLFVLANIAVDRYYHHEQRLNGSPYGSFNAFNIWKTANADKVPTKILVLGNSQHQLEMKFQEFQSSIESICGDDVQVYNLGLLAASATEYNVVLSQLELDESTVVVLPVMAMTFGNRWKPFRGDLDTQLAKPSVMRALGYDFYRDNVTWNDMVQSAAKLSVPLYKYQKISRLKLHSRARPDSGIPLVETVFDGITSGVQLPNEGNFIFNFTVSPEAESSRDPEWVHTHLAQFDRILNSLSERGIPHVVYYMPSKTDDLEKNARIKMRVDKLMAAHKTPYLDLSHLHLDSNLVGTNHIQSDAQLLALLGNPYMETSTEIQVVDTNDLTTTYAVEFQETFEVSEVSRVVKNGLLVEPWASVANSNTYYWKMINQRFHIIGPTVLSEDLGPISIVLESSRFENTGPLATLIKEVDQAVR